MLPTITTAGVVIIFALIFTSFIAGYHIGRRDGIKITLKLQKIKGYIMKEVNEVINEWNKLK